MDETITIQVNMNKFTNLPNKDNVIIVRKNNNWIGVSKEEFLSELQKELKDVKDENETLKLQMKGVKTELEETQKTLDDKIKRFESVLTDYGFNLMRGE